VALIATALLALEYAAEVGIAKGRPTKTARHRIPRQSEPADD
jgi:hypothetical protein